MIEKDEPSNSSGRGLAQEKHLSNLADSIRQEVIKIEDYARKTVKHALLAGKLLNEAKHKVGHGEWLSWFRNQNFTFSEGTAQRYMRLFRRWPELQERLVELGNPSGLTDLTFDNALQMLSDPNKLKSATSNELKPTGSTELTVRRGYSPSELNGLAKISFIEGMPTPLTFLNAADAVFQGGRVLDGVRHRSDEANQLVEKISAVQVGQWSGKVFINPIRTEDSLQSVCLELESSFLKGQLLEAILLVPTKADASWYRRFREHARVHLVKPDEEFGVDWVESLTAIYLGDRQELFFEVFQSIGDGYVPYRANKALER